MGREFVINFLDSSLCSAAVWVYNEIDPYGKRGHSMEQFWQQTSSLLWSIIRRPTIVDILDIAIVAFLLYRLLMLTRDTRASQVLKGLGILFVLYWASDVLGFKALNWILNLVVNSGAVVLVVLFQKELRSALEQIGRASSTRLDRIRQGDPRVRIDMREKCISELTTAITNLSRRRVGALVVIEQQTGLKDVIESGTHIDAEISAPLIENIFEPNTPLHDGAVIIRSGRVLGAGCMLPLSRNVNLSKDLGMRHRAGIGMSENSDAVVAIVSEETGVITMAVNGKLRRGFTGEQLTQELKDYFIVEHEEKNDRKLPFFKVKK